MALDGARRDNFVLQGACGRLGTVWVVTTEQGGAVGMFWVKGSNAAKYPAMHRQMLKRR